MNSLLSRRVTEEGKLIRVPVLKDPNDSAPELEALELELGLQMDPEILILIQCPYQTRGGGLG